MGPFGWHCRFSLSLLYAFSSFLCDVVLRALVASEVHMQAGLNALKDIVLNRPKDREAALSLLLSLTSHSVDALRSVV